jgi:hypothetical protein
MRDPLGQALDPAIPSEATNIADVKAIRRHSTYFYIIWVGLTVLATLFVGWFSIYGVYPWDSALAEIFLLEGLLILMVGFTARFWWSRLLALIAILAILLTNLHFQLLFINLQMSVDPGAEFLGTIGSLILLGMCGLRVAGRV